MDASSPSPDTDRENNRLAAIVESSDDAIIGKDLNGIITSWNASATRMFGYTAGETVGHPVTMLIPPERLEEEKEIIARVRAGERVHHYETVRRRKDGSHFEVSLTVSPVRNSAGHIIGASKIARDITDQKKTTRALELSEQRFRLLASHAPVGIFLTDEAGNCVFVNQRWCEFAGLNVSEAQGEGWSAALHPADRSRVLAEWRQALAEGRSSVAEYRFQRPDGSVAWIEGQAVKYSNEDGFQGYLGTCTDITLRKRAEMQVAFLHHLGDRLALQASPERIREDAQQMLCEHLEADRCCFLEVNPGQDTVVIGRDWHQPDLASLAGRYRLADLASAELRKRLGLPRQQIDIVSELMLPPPIADALARHEIGSVASTAYRRGGQWIFTLAVATRHPRSWLPQELELMEHVAARIWPTIERARATEALQESERLYRAIGESINYGVWVCDAEGRNIYSSDSFLQLLGITQRECQDIDWTRYLKPEEAAATTAAWSECVRAGRTWERVHHFRGADGRWHPVLSRGVPVRDDQGRITRWIGIRLDIAERENAANTERFLGRLGQQLALLTDPGEILRTAAAEIGRKLRVDRCGFADPAAPGAPGRLAAEWSREDLPAGKHPGLLESIPPDSWPRLAAGVVSADPNGAGKPGAKSAGPAFLLAPCHRPPQSPAALVVVNFAPRTWWPEDLYLLEKAVARIRPIVAQAHSALALQLSEKRHREVLTALPVACYTLDADHRINFFNEAAAELWGRRPVLHEERWCGAQALARLDGEPLPHDRSPAARAVERHQPVRGEELYVLRPDGTRRWVVSNPTPLFDGEGRPAGLISVVLDVTEQREAQKAEQQRTRTLEVLHRTSNVLVAEHELEKIVQAVTDAGRETSGAAFGAFFYNSKNEKGEIYTLFTLSGASREAFAGFPMPRATALFGPTFRGEGVVRVADVLQDPRYGKNSPRHGMPAGHLPVRSYLAVPVVSRSGEVLGGLFFGHPEPGVFTREAETVLVALAAQAAIAIDNARLYTELQKELDARRRKEELLVESERRWRQLAEAMPHLVWSCRPDGECDYLSLQWVTYTGAPEIDQLGDGWLEYIHPDDRENLVHLWRATVKAGGALDTEFRIRRADGQYRWFKSRAVPVRDPAGRITKWFGSNTDIEDVRRIELAIRQSEQELRLVTDHAPIFLAHCDREHRFKFVNPAYARRFNRTREEIVGRHVAEVVGPDAYATFRRHMDTTLAGQRTEFEQEIPYTTLGRRWVHVIYEPELNEHGEVAGLVAVVTDITARKHAELELERARDEALAASRAKDDFFATLSHELRTPLSPVLLAASDAARNPALSAETRDSFEMIHRNVSLEARLIDDLLDLTRITRGKMLLEKQPLDLHTVLQHAAANLAADFAGKDIRLELDLAAAPASVLGDPVRLQQVMGNLLANAVKFTPEHGHVRVRTAVLPGEQQIAVEIADDGIGLLPSELEGIFKPFIQGGRGRNGGTHRFGGLGLGLAISRQLVELHAGRIRAHSAGKNLGATFVVELPLAASTEATTPPPAARSATAPAAAGAPPPGRRVLLVEDHATTRKTIQKLLSRRNYDVAAAESAAAARELAAAQSFDFLVSDVGLPDGDGYQLFIELREIQPHLQGIALSGYGMEEDMQRSRAAGFQAHLIKPVSIDALENALARLPSPAPAPDSPKPPA